MPIKTIPRPKTFLDSALALCKDMIPDRILVRRLHVEGDRPLLVTFDDGPHPQLTPVVLDLLDQVGVRALFFIVGAFAEKWPNLLLDICNRGHTVGNHTFSHPNRRIASYSEYLVELSRTQEIIRAITGEAPKYARPPLGKISLGGFLALRKLGLTTILWSNGGGEWGRHENESAEFMAQRLIDSVRPGDILLLHDNNEKVPEILKRTLPDFIHMGFDMSAAMARLPHKEI